MLVLLRLWFFLRKTTPTSPELRYNRFCYGRLDYFQVYSLLQLYLSVDYKAIVIKIRHAVLKVFEQLYKIFEQLFQF